MAATICANPIVLSPAAKEAYPSFCPIQEKPSLDVVDQLSRMAIAHKSRMNDVREIFSDIIKKFTYHKDSLEERCYMLGLSIFACQDLYWRPRCPKLNVIFFQEWQALAKQNPAMINTEIYKGLLEKEAWDQLFDAMGIADADVLDEWLGPIRPTVFNQLLSEPSIAGVAFRTFLRLDTTYTIIRIRSEEDFESWEKLRNLAGMYLKQATRPAYVSPMLLLKPHKLEEKYDRLDLPKIISQVREIEIAAELLPTFTPWIYDSEIIECQVMKDQRGLEELSRRICHCAKVSIGFSPYPGYQLYPNR